MSILPHESRDGAAPNACATATHDPVCGMRADPLTARARCVHDGVPVGFCGGRCKERFLAEPLRPGEERARPGATVRHANRRYWFCGEACRERFEADPARFTGHAVPAPANAPVYTCPCHPAVRSAVPADCPECGMALEPWTPAPKRVEYVCPMHPDIVRDTPESCPICGMALEHARRPPAASRAWSSRTCAAGSPSPAP